MFDPQQALPRRRRCGWTRLLLLILIIICIILLLLYIYIIIILLYCYYYYDVIIIIIIISMSLSSLLCGGAVAVGLGGSRFRPRASKVLREEHNNNDNIYN